MSNTKPHQFRPPLYHKERDGNGKGAGRESNGDGNGNGNGKRRESNGNGDAGREQQGWDAYRKWLSSMNGQPRSRRVPIDHSVYSWKGYHTWADRVRQALKSEDN